MIRIIMQEYYIYDINNSDHKTSFISSDLKLKPGCEIKYLHGSEDYD